MVHQLSGSAVVEPALYAAGELGLLLEINVHSAARARDVLKREREVEYLLPRDCRCRVVSVVPEKSYTTQDGDRWSVTTICVEQL